MNLQDMTNYVGTKLGKTDSATLASIELFIQQRYLMIYERCLWQDSQFLLTTNVGTSGTIILPPIVDRVVAMNYNNLTDIPFIQMGTVFKAQPFLLNTTTGWMYDYTELTPVAVQTLPIAGITTANNTIASALTFSSNSTVDNGVEIRIHGDNAQAEQRESIILSSFGAVTTVNQYDFPYKITKPLTTGTITVEDSGGNVLDTYLPDEYERIHPQIMVLQAPLSTQAIAILFKRKPDRLTDPLDAPRLRNIENALLAYAFGDALELLRQTSKAQAKFQEAESLLREAEQVEKGQQQNTFQMTPVTSGEWTITDFSQYYGYDDFPKVDGF